jgi:hypothetical protein
MSHFKIIRSFCNVFAQIFFLYCFLVPSSISLSLLFLPYLFPSQFFIISFILFSFFVSYKTRSRNANHVFCSSNTEKVATATRSFTKVGSIILIATHLQGYYVRSGSNNPVMTTETVISPAN